MNGELAEDWQIVAEFAMRFSFQHIMWSPESCVKAARAIIAEAKKIPKEDK